MSELGITTTILATQLMDAVRKDEAPEEGGFDLKSGLFGRHVSDWLRMVAKELVDRKTGGEAKIPDAVLSSQLQAVDEACEDVAKLPADPPRKLRTEFAWWECSVSGDYWMFNRSKMPSDLTNHIKECDSCQKRCPLGSIGET